MPPALEDHPGPVWVTDAALRATNAIGHKHGKPFKVPVGAAEASLATAVAVDGQLQELRQTARAHATSGIDDPIAGRSPQPKLLCDGARRLALAQQLRGSVEPTKQIADRPHHQYLGQLRHLKQVAEFAQRLKHFFIKPISNSLERFIKSTTLTRR